MKDASASTVIASPEYRQFMASLKARVEAARISASRAVNCDLILLYWDIGRGIVEKQEQLGWGDSVVEMVARDLQQAFPVTQGFSPQNVWRMLQFYRTHTAPVFLSQLVRELTKNGQTAPEPEELSQVVRQMVTSVPWGHHVNALAKVADPAARLYYLRATAQFGWSRNVLLNQIKANAYDRAVTEKKTHNFPLALPEYLAEQADEAMKRLYLNLLNDKERAEGDHPSIGIILCAEKDEVEVEYALRTKKNPIGVAVYQLQAKLPAEMKGKLPTARQLADVVRAELPEGELHDSTRGNLGGTVGLAC